MKSAVFDTNVYISTILAQNDKARRVTRYLLDTYSEIKCAVVLHELLRGDKGKSPGNARSLLRRRSDLMQASLFESPLAEDWKVAGLALQQIHRPAWRSKDTLRKMTNDALIAALAIRLDCILITDDTDYDELRKTDALRSLKTFSLETIENQARN